MAIHCSSSRCAFRPTDFPDSSRSISKSQSLYDVLVSRYGTRIVRNREAIEPVLLHTREAALLHRPIRTPALIVEGVAYDADGRPVELARTFVRSDRTRYLIERSFSRDSWTRTLLAEPAARTREVAHR